MNTSISKNIKRLRQQAGLTQEQMAEKLFVTRQTVSLWENGKTQPDIQTLERIAECFGVELMAVLYGANVSKGEEEQRKEALIRTGVVTIGVFLVLTVLMQICQQYRHSETDFISRSSYVFRYLVGIYLFPVSMLICGFRIASLLNIQTKHKLRYKIMMVVSVVSVLVVWSARIMRMVVDSRNVSLILLDILNRLGDVYSYPWLFCIWGICMEVGRNKIYVKGVVNTKKVRLKK
ncbi:MAG: helix-turn-helix transcriptional regulator [Clostridia bacterium]|nr:helix-turn-helix transcriptional regulator [Clostridia bacterium]